MRTFVSAAVAAAVIAVGVTAAVAQTFPVKMASHNKGYFKGFSSVILPSYNLTFITANQATAVGGGAASRLNKVLYGVDEAMMRKLADEAHADLRAQFTAAGIPVATDEAAQAMVKASGLAVQPDNLEIVKTSGGVTLNQSLRQSWVTVGPKAAPLLATFKTDLKNTSGSNYTAQAKANETLGKGGPGGAMLVVPTLVLDFANMQAGSQTTLRGTTATTGGAAAFSIRGVASGISYGKIDARGRVFAFYTRPDGDYTSPVPFAADVAGAAQVAPTSAFGDNAARGDAVVVNPAAWQALVRDAYKSYNATLVKAALAGK